MELASLHLWLHPGCVLVFFDTSMPFFPEFWLHVAETLVLSSVGGALVALFGESAFEAIVRW